MNEIKVRTRASLWAFLAQLLYNHFFICEFIPYGCVLDSIANILADPNMSSDEDPSFILNAPADSAWPTGWIMPETDVSASLGQTAQSLPSRRDISSFGQQSTFLISSDEMRYWFGG